MEMVSVQIDIPKALEPFAIIQNEHDCMIRNAMLIYPYIQNGTISHGRAAEILGIFKMDLITLYGKLGLPYFTQSEEDLQEDLMALETVRSKEPC